MSDKNTNYEYSYYFDIETSRIPYDLPKGAVRTVDDYIQAMYLANLLEMNNSTGEFTNSWFFRTFDEFMDHVNDISNDSNKIVIYSHNLSYEFDFYNRHFNCSALTKAKSKADIFGNIEHESIIKSNRDVLAITFENMPYAKFKDSLALFNKGVKMLGDDLVKVRHEDLKKLDYNYEKIRLWCDELEPLDYEYNKRDNEIVARSIYWFMKDNNYTFKEVPLTFTANTKKHRLKYIKDRDKRLNKKNLQTINALKTFALTDFNFFTMQRSAYQGGFTSANAMYTNKLVHNVYSADEKSAYPKMMTTKRFPIFNEKGNMDKIACFITGQDANDFFQLYKDNLYNVKGYYGDFIIKNIKLKKPDYLAPLAKSHLLNFMSLTDRNSLVINGKVHQADEVKATFTNVGIEWLSLCYEWDEIYCSRMCLSTADRYLSEGEVHSLLNDFAIKEGVDKEKYAIEYALAKVNINAIYGVKVQNDLKDSYNLINGDIYASVFDKLTLNEQEEIYNNFLSTRKIGRDTQNFDLYSDGIFVTDYARLELLRMMVYLYDNGYVTVYCDTDSLYFTPKEKSHAGGVTDNENVNVTTHNNIVSNMLNDVNSQMVVETKNLYRFETFKEENDISEKLYNKICKLGTWELESGYKNAKGEFIIKPFKSFKTLGAKKYVLVGSKFDRESGTLKDYIKTTVAGCSKKVNKIIEKYADKNNISYDDAIQIIFDVDVRFDESASGRTVAKYEDRDRDWCFNRTYNGQPIYSYGGMQIVPTSYTLGVSATDSYILGIDDSDDWSISVDIDANITYNAE